MAFIGGRAERGAGAARAITDPATGATLATIPDCTPAQLETAVAAAAAAQRTWAEATPGERARVLLRLADLVERDADRIADLEVGETGKPWATMRDGELPFAVDNLRFFAGAARSLEGTGAGILSAGYTSLLIRRPIGLAGAIAPWNFPFIMAAWKIGP
ncbi:MAG: aldehyde dehydrogenase family protein, partial [Chloroflexota bacterium]